MAQFDETEQNRKLSELRQKEEEEFVKTAAQNRGARYVNLTQVPIDMDALALIPEDKARAALAVVFEALDKRLGIAVVNPDDERATKLIQSFIDSGYAPSIFLVSHRSIEHALAFYQDISKRKETQAGTFDISKEEVDRVLEAVHTVKDIKALIASALSGKQHYRTTQVVEIILAGALAIGASDVHIEPEQESVRLRYRLDGVLNDILAFDYATYQHVLSRIKLISGLKLNVKTEAQDGRFSINARQSEMEVRTSVLPGNYGEALVLRVLDPETISVPLEELGLEPRLHEILEREINRPNGMILTTGPTGSGKTTTLYACLKKVYSPDIKVITIEDPVEYHLQGIVQTQVSPDKGYTFSAGLRAAMRQDPDVIMVGEIRDNETAEIAVNAATTGHLVFSTLHTNNAAGTFPRLLGLGVNPKLISSSVTVALAQRLARRLCASCKKETPLDGADKRLVEAVVATIPEDRRKVLQLKTVWSAAGCEHCNHTGYKGRIGIFEAILMSKEIEAVVIKNPSEREVGGAAKSQGILTMPQDGIIKLLQGITSLDELRRVIDLETSS